MMCLLRYIMTGCYIVCLKRKVTSYITENYEAQTFIIYDNHNFYISKNKQAQTLCYDVQLYTTHFSGWNNYPSVLKLYLNEILNILQGLTLRSQHIVHTVYLCVPHDSCNTQIHKHHFSTQQWPNGLYSASTPRFWAHNFNKPSFLELGITYFSKMT
jgi:hypothetical protein